MDWTQIHIPKFLTFTTLFSLGENAALYPFTVLKTREQIDRAKGFTAVSGTVDLFKRTVREEGPRALYRGFWTYSIWTLPSYGLYLLSYKKLHHSFEGAENASTTRKIVAPMAAGLLADVISNGLYVPIDIVVQRMQMKDSPYKSAQDAVQTIWRKEGLRGFYRGFGATVMTYGTMSAVWWMCYENTKELLYKHDPRALYTATIDPSEPNRPAQIIAGLLAGAAMTVVSNPLDLVKTRIQTQLSEEGKYRNMLQGLRTVVREEGYVAFLRGMVPKVVSRAPLMAVSSLLYETVLSLSKLDKA